MHDCGCPWSGPTHTLATGRTSRAATHPAMARQPHRTLWWMRLRLILPTITTDLTTGQTSRAAAHPAMARQPRRTLRWMRLRLIHPTITTDLTTGRTSRAAAHPAMARQPRRTLWWMRLRLSPHNHGRHPHRRPDKPRSGASGNVPTSRHRAPVCVGRTLSPAMRDRRGSRWRAWPVRFPAHGPLPRRDAHRARRSGCPRTARR